MPFVITPDDQRSFLELAQLANEGAHVLKTPHVGNSYPSNLAVAALGIPMLLVDQTIGAKDHNFHPHKLIVGGRAEVISDERLLTTHARVSTVPTRFADRFPLGARVADAHVHALRDAFPRAPIETVSERAKRCRDLLLPLFELLTEIEPIAWTRQVGRDGLVYENMWNRSWKSITSAGIHGLTDDRSGWLVPNAWNILSDGVIGAIESGRDTVYALSGPDMIRYYKALLPDMTRWYDFLRPRFSVQLPETLTMVMVPAAEMRLVTTAKRREALNELVDVYLRFRETKRGGAHIATLKGEARAEAIAARGIVCARATENLRDAAIACPDVFYRIEDANCFTQYDLLDGEELFIHPWGIESPLRDVKELVGTCTRLLCP